MTNIRTLAAVAAIVAVPALSHAGFTASTNSFAATNSSTFTALNNTLTTTTAGTLVSFNPDTANDPQIGGNDLSSYRFSLNATVVTSTLGVATYAGTYRLFYDFAGGINVSTGTAAFTASQFGTRLDILSGLLTQTAGPANPAFTDLGAKYNFNPLSITGTFTQKANDPTTGTLQINFAQDAQAVPEPSAFAALGLGALGILGRRRRKA